MPNDRGPIYLETLAGGRFPVEPWNTYSNLLFLAVIVFWFFRVRGSVRDHCFIAYCLPVFLLGWVGGTVYHATRSHNVWLFLDFGPIALLALAAAMFFWRRQGMSWFLAPLLVFGPLALAAVTIPLLSDSFPPARWLGFPVIVITILAPVFGHLVRAGWKEVGLVAGVLAAFAVAIGFRSIDLRIPISFLPMGTHWLWHSFGAVAVHLLILYIYRDDRRRAEGAVDRKDSASVLVHA